MSIEFIDRVPTKAGRVKLTLDDGSSYYATLERADEPVETGTPLNAATFNSLVAEVDGKQASLFRGSFAGDFDTAIEPGVYWCNLSNCTNGPAASGYGHLEVFKNADNSTLKMQRFTFYHNGEAFTRTYVNDQWYAWFSLAGSVSGWPTARCKLLNTRSGGWSSGASISIPELANCDAALVVYCSNSGWSTAYLRSIIIPVGKTGVLQAAVNMASETYLTFIQRRLTIGSDGTVTSGEVLLKSTNSNTAATDSTNFPHACSPYKIYGLKW